MTPTWYRVRLSLTVPPTPHVFGPIGMAAVLTKCTSITDEVFLETSRLLAALTPAEGLAHGRLFPAFSDLKVCGTIARTYRPCLLCVRVYLFFGWIKRVCVCVCVRTLVCEHEMHMCVCMNKFICEGSSCTFVSLMFGGAV